RCYRDWSSDVCSSDLGALGQERQDGARNHPSGAVETTPSEPRRLRIGMRGLRRERLTARAARGNFAAAASAHEWSSPALQQESEDRKSVVEGSREERG